MKCGCKVDSRQEMVTDKLFRCSLVIVHYVIHCPRHSESNVSKLEQERDALAGEVRRLRKAALAVVEHINTGRQAATVAELQSALEQETQ